MSSACRTSNAFWFGPMVIAGMALLLLFLPVILPVVAIADTMDRRRLRTMADWSRCLRCGHVLGMEALDLADTEWSRFVQALHRDHSGTRFRLVRTVRAICGRCGCRHGYDGRFHLAPEDG